MFLFKVSQNSLLPFHFLFFNSFFQVVFSFLIFFSVSLALLLFTFHGTAFLQQKEVVRLARETSGRGPRRQAASRFW
jgi:hypothetical protein